MDIKMREQSWIDYAALFLDEFEENKENLDLVKLVNEKDLAAVIRFHLGGNSVSWLNTKIDALNGRTPLQCLESESGTVLVKEILMRFH